MASNRKIVRTVLTRPTAAIPRVSQAASSSTAAAFSSSIVRIHNADDLYMVMNHPRHAPEQLELIAKYVNQGGRTDNKIYNINPDSNNEKDVAYAIYTKNNPANPFGSAHIYIDYANLEPKIKQSQSAGYVETAKLLSTILIKNLKTNQVRVSIADNITDAEEKKIINDIIANEKLDDVGFDGPLYTYYINALLIRNTIAKLTLKQISTKGNSDYGDISAGFGRNDTLQHLTLLSDPLLTAVGVGYIAEKVTPELQMFQIFDCENIGGCGPHLAELIGRTDLIELNIDVGLTEQDIEDIIVALRINDTLLAIRIGTANTKLQIIINSIQNRNRKTSGREYVSIYDPVTQPDSAQPEGSQKITNVETLNRMLDNKPNSEQIEMIAEYVNHGDNLRNFLYVRPGLSELEKLLTYAILTKIDPLKPTPTGYYYLDFYQLHDFIQAAEERGDVETAELLATILIPKVQARYVGILANKNMNHSDYTAMLQEINDNEHLTSVGFSGHINIRVMSQLLRNPRIEGLKFRAMSHGDDDYRVLSLELKNNSTLKFLHLKEDPLLTNQGVFYLTETLPASLDSLEIINCDNISGSGQYLANLITRTNLTSLEINIGSNRDIENIVQALQRNHTLIKIKISLRPANATLTKTIHDIEQRNLAERQGIRYAAYVPPLNPHVDIQGNIIARTKPRQINNVADLNRMMDNGPNAADVELIARYVNQGGDVSGFAYNRSLMSDFEMLIAHIIYNKNPNYPVYMLLNYHVDYYKLMKYIEEAEQQGQVETVKFLSSLSVLNWRHSHIGLKIDKDMPLEDSINLIDDVNDNENIISVSLSGHVNELIINRLLLNPRITSLKLSSVASQGDEDYKLFAREINLNDSLTSLAILNDRRLTAVGVKYLADSLPLGLKYFSIDNCPNIGGCGQAIAELIDSIELFEISINKGLNEQDLKYILAALQYNASLLSITIGNNNNKDFQTAIDEIEERNDHNDRINKTTLIQILQNYKKL